MSPATDPPDAPDLLDQPLRLRCRRDVDIRQQHYRGQRCWVVKDPISLRYFRLQPIEYQVWQSLDGERSLRQIHELLQASSGGRQVTIDQLQPLVGLLHQQGLLLSATAGVADRLLQRAAHRRRRQFWARLSNPLSIRLPGINPEAALQRLLPLLGWLFTPLGLALVGLLTAGSAVWVAVHFSDIARRLPSFEEFFAAQHWPALVVTLAAVKIAHELGHALACKRFGAHCPEMGVMLLVFMPVLYCDASDAWMLPSKWRRIWISAAGMYVELLLASLASWVWWFSEPGVVNQLALSVMFVCSVSTLAFNANPLMKLDGYYILMDWLEVPNLRAKSTRYVTESFQKHALGIASGQHPSGQESHRWWLAVYGLAAPAYRVVIVFSIAWFLYHVLQPYGLQLIGQAIATLALGSLVLTPILKLWRFLRVPGRLSSMRPIRAVTTAGITAAAVAVCVWLPLPMQVPAAAEIDLAEAFEVRPPSTATLLRWHVQPGDRVRAGDPLAVLESLPLELERATASGELQLARKRLELIQRQARLARGLENLVPQHAALAEASQRLFDQTDQRFRRLDVVAPVDGIVYAAPSRPRPASDRLQLASWSGQPMEPSNLEAVVSEAELLCVIGQTDRWQATLMIDQADIELVRLGDAVEIRLDAWPMTSLHGHIDQLSEAQLQLPRPAADSPAAPLPTTLYQARVQLRDVAAPLRPGYRGQARIELPPRSLAWRWHRWFTQTFRLEL
jgi:putative peptide zinc metalloprotease protein